LTDMTFVFTGVMDVNRDICTAAIAKYGGRCTSAVSKKTT